MFICVFGKGKSCYTTFVVEEIISFGHGDPWTCFEKLELSKRTVLRRRALKGSGKMTCSVPTNNWDEMKGSYPFLFYDFSSLLFWQLLWKGCCKVYLLSTLLCKRFHLFVGLQKPMFVQGPMEESFQVNTVLPKAMDKDDTSTDSVCSVFEKMKPYWVRMETADEQPKSMPISPISSQSCLYSSQNNGLSDDSRVIQSPVSNIQEAAYEVTKNCQQGALEQNFYRPHGSQLEHQWLVSSYSTTAAVSQATSDNIAPVLGNQSTVIGSGFCEAAVYSWYNSRTYFNAIQWCNQMYSNQENRMMGQWIHPLSFNNGAVAKILPTAEPGDFSTSRNGLLNVIDSGMTESIDGKHPYALSDKQGNCHLNSEPKSIKKRYIKYDELNGETTKREVLHPTGSTNKPKKCKRDNYLRFEHWEEENLLRGVEKFGVGKWTSILRNFTFQKKRSAIDLKDKYRNLVRAKRRTHLAQLNAMKL